VIVLFKLSKVSKDALVFAIKTYAQIALNTKIKKLSTL